MTITLITGANKGPGRETARRLLEIGYTVLIGVRDAERGQRTADELGGVFLKIDPTSDTSVAAAVGQVENDYGRLDVVRSQSLTTDNPDAAQLAKFGPASSLTCVIVIPCQAG